uniref:Transmembrane protein 39A-like n=1 Tax=Phallusia mammillata TaxID=59560 RepID=A0A6F9DUH4_9ASCI|nr:transmembrane protein 39A-like [Phallusia mammillata]
MPYRRISGKQTTLGGRSRLTNKGLNQSTFPISSASSPKNVSSGEANKTTVTLVAVNHPKIPDLPTMNPLGFEFLYLGYLLTALFGQLLSIYKTVWWYPSTLPPSTMTMNFHLIDKNLTVLIALLFVRRVLYTIMWKHLKPSTDNMMYIFVWILACLVVGCIWIIEIMQNVVALHETFTSVKLMFLYYPLIFWLPIYWISENGFLTYSLGCLKGQKNSKNCLSLKSPGRLKDQPESIGDGRTSYINLGNACDAEQVREEVNLLCCDFNSRLAEIVFSSLLGAYYVGLVPIFYTETYQSFDVAWSLQYTALILVNTFSMLTSFLLPPRYLQVLHKCASLLGGYELVGNTTNITSETIDSCEQWSPSVVFSVDALVQYQDNIYKAVGKHNTACPNNSTHQRFFFMFYKPLRVLNWLLGLHFAIAVFQIHLLIWSTHWDQLIIPALLQFFSYFILFTTLRDRIVLGKAYAIYDGSLSSSRIWFP